MAGAEVPIRKDLVLPQTLINRTLGHVRGLTREGVAQTVSTKKGRVDIKSTKFSKISGENPFVLSLVSIPSDSVPLAPVGSVTIYSPDMKGGVKESQYLIFERREKSEHVEPHTVRTVWKKEYVPGGVFPTDEDEGQKYAEAMERVDLEQIAMGLLILSGREWPIDEGSAGRVSRLPFFEGYEEVKDETEILAIEEQIQLATGRALVD